MARDDDLDERTDESDLEQALEDLVDELAGDEPPTALALDDGPAQRYARAGVRLVLVAALLVVGELLWMVLLDDPFTGRRLLTLAAAMLSIALLAELVLGAAYGLAYRLSPRGSGWVVTAFALPLLLAAAESLFSGAWIRDLPGVLGIKVVFIVVLVLATRLGFGLYASLAGPAPVPFRAAGLGALATAWLALGWIDVTQQVGRYPAFQLLLAAGIVFCVDMLGRLALPRRRRVPLAAGMAGLGLLLVALGFTVASWHSPEATQLVSSTHGLLPKFRIAVVRALHPVPALARTGDPADLGPTTRATSAAAGLAGPPGGPQGSAGAATRRRPAPDGPSVTPGALRHVLAEPMPEQGRAFHVVLPPEFEALAARPESEHPSPLVLLEDGVPLGPANALHSTVRQEGCGAHSHWKHGLFFSSSDDSDPRTNGRRYEVVLPTPSAPRPSAPRPGGTDDEFALVPTALDQGAHDGAVVDRLLREPLGHADVEAVLSRFWELGDETRRLVLETLFRREVTEAGELLAALRRGSWESDDQAVAVLAAWAGSRDAAVELAERFDLLDASGRRWLAETLRAMPRSAALTLAPVVLPDLERRAAAAPPLGSDAERYVSLVAAALPDHLRGELPGWAKALLVERFNAYSVTRPSTSFATLSGRRFLSRHFLHALRRSLEPGDVPVLAEVAHNRDSAYLLPFMAHDIDSPAARTFLLDLIDRWDSPSEVDDAIIDSMIPGLSRFDDAVFHREADRRIQARFPEARRVP